MVSKRGPLRRLIQLLVELEQGAHALDLELRLCRGLRVDQLAQLDGRLDAQLGLRGEQSDVFPLLPCAFSGGDIRALQERS